MKYDFCRAPKPTLVHSVIVRVQLRARFSREDIRPHCVDKDALGGITLWPYGYPSLVVMSAPMLGDPVSTLVLIFFLRGSRESTSPKPLTIPEPARCLLYSPNTRK